LNSVGRPRIPDKENRITPKHIQLMRAAYQVLAEKGLSRFALQDVANRVNVSKGVVLYYFGTKDRLLLSTWSWVLSRVADRIREAVDRSPTPEGKVRAMVEAIFISPEANRTFYLTFLDLVGTVARKPGFEALVEVARRIEEETYAAVIRVGVAEGIFRSSDPEQDAKVLRGLIDGLFLQWLQEKNWRECHAAYKRLCQEAILRYLGCPRDAPPGDNEG
jgi:AcrR family transcriptional regulator